MKKSRVNLAKQQRKNFHQQEKPLVRPAVDSMSPDHQRWNIFALLSIILVGILIYWNSLHCPFLFDDHQIEGKAALHHLHALGNILAHTNRPLLNLSLAFNYAIGQVDVFSYHVFNLVVHIGASLILFGLIRRTFLLPILSVRYAALALPLAWGAALWWMAHPLQTQSVTYIIQRTESMMGFFYLATLYSLARGITSRRFQKIWYALAIFACALAMASKEVAATIPIVVVAYQRIFLTSSWKELLRRFKGLNIGLALTWIVQAFLLSQTDDYARSAGFLYKGFAPWQYTLTQPAVVLHYLKLSFWPASLCIDYVWMPVRRWEKAVIPLAGIFFLLGWTLVQLKKNPPLGFLGFWFFVILSVSSSFIPIQDIAFEHRMYLSLAAVVVLTLITLERYLSGPSKQTILIATIIVVTAVLGFLTIQRNKDYQSEIAMWQDVVEKRPGNPRGYNDLGFALMNAKRYDEAKPYLLKAVQLFPKYAEAFNNLGMIALDQGNLAEAQKNFEKAISLDTQYPEFLNNLGLVFFRQKKIEEAVVQYEKAIAAYSDFADAYNNRGVAMVEMKRFDDAIRDYRRAIECKPHFSNAYNNLGVAYILQNRWAEAKSSLSTALALNPQYPKAMNNLGVVLKNEGDYRRARAYFVSALKLQPDYPEAQRNLQEVGGRVTE